MTAAHIYLPQVIALVALSFLTALAVLVTRMRDLLRNKRPLSFYEDLDVSGAPLSVQRPTRQLANQFEFPVLFYALVVIAVAIPVTSPTIAALAWAYVALRWAHAASQIVGNRLYIRTPIFMLGNVTLLMMWVTLGLIALG